MINPAMAAVTNNLITRGVAPRLAEMNASAVLNGGLIEPVRTVSRAFSGTAARNGVNAIEGLGSKLNFLG